MTQGHTLESLLAAATERLENAGTTTPRLDAELLLSHQLDCSRTRFMTWPEQKVAAEDADAYRALVAQRCEGTPSLILRANASSGPCRSRPHRMP